MLILGSMAWTRRIYVGWWTVAALFLAAAFTVGSSQYAFGMFVEPLQDAFGWSRTQISASLSFAGVGGLAAPLLGRAMDRYGARPVMVISLTLFGVSYLLRPLMTELWHWYALSVLQFLGFSGAAFLPAGRLVGIWFPKKRGRVMGVAAMGNNFGGLVFPPVVGLALGLTSWQGAYMVLALLGLLVILYALTAVREHPPTTTDEPPAPGPETTERRGPPDSLTGWSVKDAVRSKAFYAITATVLLGTFTYSAVLPQVFAHLTNEGASAAAASTALSLLAAFGMGGKLAFGYLAERITARYALMLCLAGEAGFLTLMLNSETPAFMWVSVPLFGLCMGAFGATFQLVVQDTFGIRNYGGIMGLINLTTVVSLACGPLMAGASYDLTGSYRAAFITVAGMFLLAALMLSQAGQPRLQRGPASGRA